ncbi:MAG: hypothetical protein K9M45_13330 [Kiritimatiellales bacterium]|nr:hypothetical protein [Kiritimatiellales bacterium]
MTDNLSKVPGPSGNPEAKQSRSGKPRWPLSVRISLWSLLAAIGFFLVSMVVMLAGLRSGWLVDVADTHAMIGGICMLLAVVSCLTCIISGLVAMAKKHPVVLWWLIPLLTAIGLFIRRIL